MAENDNPKPPPEPYRPRTVTELLAAGVAFTVSEEANGAVRRCDVLPFKRKVKE